MKTKFHTICTVFCIGIAITSCRPKQAVTSDAGTTQKDTLLCTDSILTVGSAIEDTLANTERKGPFMENDTMVLYKGTFVVDGTTYTQKAYVNTNRSFDERLNSFRIFHDEADKKEFDKQMKRYKETHPQPLTQFPSPNLSEDWLPIMSYHGKYYFTAMGMYPQRITDSLYIINTMDGPIPHILKSYKQISQTHYQFIIENAYNKNEEQIQHIYIIDPKRKIAVIESIDKDTKGPIGFCRLFIAAENAMQLDYIAWISVDMPEDKLIGFDKIDYEALLKPFKNVTTNE